MAASFDGTGGTYLTRTGLASLNGTFPFWYGAWVRLVKNPTHGTVYAIVNAARTDSTIGHAMFIYKNAPSITAVSGGGAAFTNTLGDEGIIQDPYWEHILCVYLSNTDRRIYLNGVFEGVGTEQRDMDISTGTPLFRIGIRVSGSQPFKGLIADVTVGTGIPSNADRILLYTPGGPVTGVTGITNHYPLLSNGNDAIAGANMTASGTVVYTSDVPAARAQPTRAAMVLNVFQRSTLRTELPTVTPGGTSVITSLTNLADVEYIDCAFTGSDGAWNTRMFHHIPKARNGHLVIVDGGHQHTSQHATYGMDVLVRELVAHGYSVLFSQMPGFSSQDPIYTGGAVNHDTFWTNHSDTVKPIEKMLASHTIALNNLAPRYSKRSFVGLSGGGWTSVHYAALDTRINHAVVPIRGTLASRRNRTIRDFEQHPSATGWKTEEFYRHAASPNRRVWFVSHVDDPTIAAQLHTLDSGGYLDATTYRSTFFTPISAEFPASDVKFIEDGGSAPHAVTSWVRANVVFPALSRTLNRRIPTRISRGVVGVGSITATI